MYTLLIRFFCKTSCISFILSRNLIFSLFQADRIHLPCLYFPA
jgi:hypothetical protein